MVDMYEIRETPSNCNYNVIENCLSFGQALDKLIERENNDKDTNEYGIRIRTWTEGIVIRIQTLDANSKMSKRYLYKNHEGKNIPWVPNNEFIFNNFWEVVKFVKNKDVIPDTNKETIDKMTNSIHDNKNYEAWSNNPDIQNEFDEYRRRGEKLRKAYDRYRNFVNKIEDNDKCAPHCAKKCLNECHHKAETKPNNNQTIIIKGDVKKLIDTFDEIIDAMLS